MIHKLNSCTSTNELGLNAKEPQHGETWIAFEQSEGRGRRHAGERRAWFSPPDSGVYFSIVLLPHCDASKVEGLTLAVGAALCEVLQNHDIDCWLKWPNDIFVGSKKIAGILTEAHTHHKGIERIVIGVGINVNMEPHQIPEELKNTLISMSMCKQASFDRLKIAHLVRDNILAWSNYFFDQGIEPLFNRIQAFDKSVGLSLKLSDGREGISMGITKKGLLAVKYEDHIFEVNSGEVKFRFPTNKQTL